MVIMVVEIWARPNESRQRCELAAEAEATLVIRAIRARDLALGLPALMCRWIWYSIFVSVCASSPPQTG